MMQPDAYEFFDWSPHDIKHMLFGSRIIEPDEPDPYTQDELDERRSTWNIRGRIYIYSRGYRSG